MQSCRYGLSISGKCKDEFVALAYAATVTVCAWHCYLEQVIIANKLLPGVRVVYVLHNRRRKTDAGKHMYVAHSVVIDQEHGWVGGQRLANISAALGRCMIERICGL